MRTLKAHPETAQLPILFATAATHNLAPLETQLDAYGVPVLHKPFAIEELLDLVQQLLHRHAA